MARRRYGERWTGMVARARLRPPGADPSNNGLNRDGAGSGGGGGGGGGGSGGCSGGGCNAFPLLQRAHCAHKHTVVAAR